MPKVEIDVEIDADNVMHMLNEEDIVEFLADTYPHDYWPIVLNLCPFDVKPFLTALEFRLREWRSEDLAALKQLVAKIETENKEVSDVA